VWGLLFVNWFDPTATGGRLMRAVARCFLQPSLSRFGSAGHCLRLVAADAEACALDRTGRFRLGFNFSYASAPPFIAFVGPNDFNGDGTTNDLLPGTTVNAFNLGLTTTYSRSICG
jgi:hypothetical protein